MGGSLGTAGRGMAAVPMAVARFVYAADVAGIDQLAGVAEERRFASIARTSRGLRVEARAEGLETSLQFLPMELPGTIGLRRPKSRPKAGDNGAQDGSNKTAVGIDGRIFRSQDALPRGEVLIHLPHASLAAVSRRRRPRLRQLAGEWQAGADRCRSSGGRRLQALSPRVRGRQAVKPGLTWWTHAFSASSSRLSRSSSSCSKSGFGR